ncbi:hypothetical protein ACM66B_004159 [Microbotryomycetes sp. NB124-2]
MTSTSTDTKASSTAAEQALKDDADLFNDGELERILNQEASQVTREAEVMRVLKAFKMNPYEILELNWMPNAGVTEADIQKSYRKRSLLIHPDKLQHPRGIEAFDLLKKASGELLDADKRKALDETLQDARMLVLRGEGLPRDTPDNHDEVKSLKNPDFKERVRQKAKEIIIDEELRRRRVTKMTMIAEGAEAKRQEDAIAERKRKIEEKQRWEDTREDRVSDWRSFQKGPQKKKKKTNVLGSFTLAVPASVLRFFAKEYPTLEFNIEWLQGCCEYLNTAYPGLTPVELNHKVEFQLLASNLSTSVLPSNKLLPSSPNDSQIRSSFASKSRKQNDKSSSLSSSSKVVLFPQRNKDAVLVQVVKVDDVSNSALDMLDTLKDQRERRKKALRLQQQQQQQQARADQDGPKFEDEPKVFKRGTLKLSLSDGHSEVDAFEMNRIQGFGLDEIKLGCKLLLHNVKVVRGILMLTPDTVTIKGNLVEELEAVAEQDFENTLRERLRMPPLNRRAPAAANDAQQVVANPAAPARPPARIDDNFDIVMDDDDDDELDLDAIAAIEEAELASRAAVRQTNGAESGSHRTVTSQRRQKPVVSPQELAELEVIELSD